MKHLWVDPVKGSDSRSGGSRSQALRTLAAAWLRIPASRALTAGYHIHILRGTLPPSAIYHYWESRWGSREAPIIIEAVEGRGSVVLQAPVNVFDVRHLHLIGLIIRAPGDPFHCERCTNLLLRNGVCASGSWLDCGVQEAIKINQCRGVWIEGVVAGWANDNAFDCVSCQYGHILNSRFHHSEWGVYLKGGSAYFIVASNEIHTHGSSGFAAGQGTGFEFMDAPWLQYEAYDIKLYNNLIRNIEGAGFGVWGCYNCMYAYNTLVGVGNRSHLIDIKFGERTCDGNPRVCSANKALGGWGPRTVGPVTSIPNRNVFIINNVIYNPPGTQSQWQHLQVDDPRGSLTSDKNLVIRGNVVWNGGADKPLGVGEACTAANPTCNPTQLVAQNAFNTVRPDLSRTTFRPASATGKLATYTGLWRPIAAFPAWAAAVVLGPAVPTGRLANAVAADRAGEARTAQRDAPGAYVPPNSIVG
ncbi:hypothetical protein CHLNCDRAFT_18721 [Chlorella variabilis]|uniref:Right handed beta helix domain-containing protein n=1 Tax=Chlorella variabilis TaxID=554065 RepID=E1Z3N1_CHLVA|nr:hypothetical protein CHLNCDRAFT_18721 [Chlorella variabilis]EFN59876.1 hypothetical protein CHLNCDRAFT_18721 [Chlorella variabilis]|eukprot:XP_005851978.1 hypothetical protein CHLNCDRAFT_18721 [Chlorella variabilis]